MKSIIALPDNYTVIDLETTGSHSTQDEIIELSAIRIRQGVEVARYSQLVNPNRKINAFVSALTGITDGMVADCPHIETAIQEYSDFIGEDILVGHNIAGFDTVFLARAYEQHLGKPLSNECVDTFRIAKKIYPKLRRYTLEYLAAYLCVKQSQAHRGLADCETANACFSKIKEEVLTTTSEEELKALFCKKSGSAKASDIKPETNNFDTCHPFYQKSIVFTGAMMLTRSQAMQLAVNVGAYVKPSVSSKTDFLVVGTQDIDRVGADGMSSKEEKAYALNSSGTANITIITESDFLKMVN